MQIELTPEQDRYLRQAIDSGRVEGKEQAVQEAITFWMSKELLQKAIQELLQSSRQFRDDPKFQRLTDLISMAANTFKTETSDDPFHAFDEWNGDADRKAYADL